LQAAWLIGCGIIKEIKVINFLGYLLRSDNYELLRKANHITSGVVAGKENLAAQG